MPKVTMPQLGESVAEGTIGRWLKQAGGHAPKREPIVEVITDKVNAEVPSPFEGTLTAILVQEGETVPNNAEIAVIDGAGEAVATPAAPAAAAPPPPAPAPAAAPAAGDELKPMTPMRKAIVAQMVKAKSTAPHAYTTVEVDMSGVVALRESAEPAPGPGCSRTSRQARSPSTTRAGSARSPANPSSTCPRSPSSPWRRSSSGPSSSRHRTATPSASGR